MLRTGGAFFFFKQKTAYEMRISDWSSDVCSSDRAQQGHVVDEVRDQRAGRAVVEESEVGADQLVEELLLDLGDHAVPDMAHQHRLAVGGTPTQREDRAGGERDGVEQRRLFEIGRAHV